MFLTPKQSQIRNIALAISNGAVSLVILLIAPLGLATVITLTALITAITYGLGTLIDKIFTWMQSPTSGNSLSANNRNFPMRRIEDTREIDRTRE